MTAATLLHEAKAVVLHTELVVCTGPLNRLEVLFLTLGIADILAVAGRYKTLA